MTEADRRRPVRSYVLREGRLTRAQERAFTELWPRFGLDWRPGAALDLPALFGEGRPVYLEIGFGNGETLSELAARHPERAFLGIEVHRPGVGHLLLELEKRGLTNVRVLRHDAVEVLEHGLPPGSLSGVYLFFPDPWPKTRHHKRRLLNPGTARLIARALSPGGLLHVATDWEDYAEQMLAVLSDCPELINAAGHGAFAPRPEDRPLTRFERRGRRLGHQVRDLVFRRR
jgi:tRNA (guanine-N7-)-methyltransferase